jgi:hypothetical protein
VKPFYLSDETVFQLGKLRDSVPTILTTSACAANTRPAMLLSNLPVEALEVAITDGEHAYSSLTEDQVQQLRDLLLAIRARAE